jgi:hypothetical protein
MAAQQRLVAEGGAGGHLDDRLEGAVEHRLAEGEQFLARISDRKSDAFGSGRHDSSNENA